VGSFPIGGGVGGDRNLSKEGGEADMGEDGTGKGGEAKAVWVASSESAMSTASSSWTAIEIVGYHREKAMLPMGSAVLAASGIERGAHRREGIVVGHLPLLRLAVTSPRTFA
jgi:hypothetical protein